MGAGRVRERPGRAVPASHVANDEACVSFYASEGNSANDRRQHASRNDHDASGSFISRESFSVYSRGMATMATKHHGHP